MKGGTALIQGASRGLGLQFCKHLLVTRPSLRVVGTCRRPNSSDGLKDLKTTFKDRFEVLSLDVTQEEEIKAVASHVQAYHDEKLDLLINCAGMLHPSGKGETSLRDVTFEGLEQTMRTNALGPLILSKHLGKALRKGGGTFGSEPTGSTKRHKGVVVNISARVGSIADNGYGGWYSYRMSKSALNMATKNLSIELGRSQVLCITLHPGTVDTDLSRPYHRNVPKEKLFSPEYSISRMMSVIDKLTLEDSGKFFSWNGEVLPF